MKLLGIKIKTKLMLIGVVVTLTPLVAITVTVFVQNKTIVATAERESLGLAYEDLDHVVDNLYIFTASHQEVTQKNIIQL